MRALLDELARALMGHGAHLEELIAQLLDVLPEPVDILALIAEQVALVANDDLRALGKLRAVLAQLRIYRVKVLDRVAPLAAVCSFTLWTYPAAVDVAENTPNYFGLLMTLILQV